MRSRAVVSVVLGVLLIALLAACGSKKSSTGTTTPTTTAAAAGGSGSGSGSGSGAGSGSGSGSSAGSGSGSGSKSFASTKNCKELEGLAAKVSQSFQPNANGELDLSKEADALDALANAAPDEIKGDFKTFAEAFKKFAKVYGDVKIKPGQTPSAEQIAKLTAAAQSFNTAKLQQATTHLSTWASSHCGISSTG
jgi:hypothetical protein